MNVYKPVLWDAVPNVDYGADTIELARIVPQVGEFRRVYLDKYDRVKDGQAISCIWSPPFSDVNGWSDQPSEIALSYIVTGIAHLKPTAASEHIPKSDYFQQIASNCLTLEIAVRRTRPLIDALALAEPDCAFNFPMYLWQECENFSSASVAGYRYLTTRHHETVLEALIHITGEQIVLGYHCYRPPCESEHVILNNQLGPDERVFFKQVISIAAPINDSYQRYLI